VKKRGVSGLIQRQAVSGSSYASFTMDEIRRYGRHLIMPEVGLEGQRRLKDASVLVVGVGGLGAPVSLYLAAAGVGKIGLLDFDEVDETNLQRQVIFSTPDVGRKKVEVARAVVVKAVQRARKVKQLSPRVKQIADYLWDEIPRKYKEGKDRIWTYISVVALAKAIDEALGDRDWKSVDWAQEIDWASGYRNAKAVVHKILGVGGGFKGLTAREVEELVRKWNEVREELKLPETIDPWELKALFD